MAETSRRRLQYLYQDEEGVHVMDTTTFEQFAVPHTAAARVKDWLQDGLELYALMHEDAPVMVPSFVQQGEAIIVNPATGEFVRRA